MTAAREANLTRRSFLVGTTAVLGGALLLGPGSVRHANALSRHATAGGRRLAIGYVVNSDGADPDQVHALIRTAGTRVVPATSVGARGGRFEERSASIRIDGLTPGLGEGQRPDVGAAYLDAMVVAPRGSAEKLLPFYAWTLDRRAPDLVSHASSFVLPVEYEPTVGFKLRVGGPSAGARREWQEASAVLTAGRERDLPKLRPGTYVLGFDPDVWATARTLPSADDAGAWAPLASVAVTVRAV